MNPAAGALQSSDDPVRSAALHALTEVSMHHPDILADVRVALLSPSPVVRSAAILCWQRTKMGPEEMVRMGLLHRDRLVRQAALQAVCSWGTEDGLPACRRALRDSHEDLVATALRLVVQHGYAVEPELLVATLSASNRSVVLMAAVLLTNMQHEAGIPHIEAALACPQHDDYALVVRHIGSAGLTHYAAVLHTHLHHEHPHLVAVIQALGRLGHRPANRQLLSYLTHSNDHVRTTASHALIAIADHSVINALRGACLDCRSYVRTAAAWTLVGFDQDIDALVLRDILIQMRPSEALLWLKRWLTGDGERVSERIIRLHSEIEWCLTKEARTYVRRIIAAHPEHQQIRLRLHAAADPQISLTLLPLYSEQVLPLLSAALLVHILADDRLRKGGRLRPLADMHIKNNPQTLRLFWPHADESFHQFYGEYCLLTMNHDWHALIWQTRSPVLQRRYLKFVASLVHVAPGFVATIPAAGIAWLQQYAAPEGLYEHDMVRYVTAWWQEQQTVGNQQHLNDDPFATAEIFVAWAAVSPSGIAHRMIQLHENPLMPITIALRELLRTVLGVHPDAPAIRAILHEARRPSIDATLMPWYRRGALPALSAERVEQMRTVYADVDDIQLPLSEAATSICDVP
jgi:HEAT repeat protein